MNSRRVEPAHTTQRKQEGGNGVGVLQRCSDSICKEMQHKFHESFCTSQEEFGVLLCPAFQGVCWMTPFRDRCDTLEMSSLVSTSGRDQTQVSTTDRGEAGMEAENRPGTQGERGEGPRSLFCFSFIPQPSWKLLLMFPAWVSILAGEG